MQFSTTGPPPSLYVFPKTDFSLTASEARLRIGDVIEKKRTVEEGTTEVRFEFELKPGDTELQICLIENDGSLIGAYFVEVERSGGR